LWRKPVSTKRIIPLFLLKGKRLYKGTGFSGYLDVGDPVSQGMIYDAQGADEIVIVDIEASQKRGLIDTRIINDMITKCRLPIGAGGGIRSVKDARTCFHSGADKIVINTHAVQRPSLIREMADEFGAQSVLVSIDVKRNPKDDYDIYIYSGQQKADVKLRDFIQQAIEYGAGELIITSIDREGALTGFDHALYKKVGDITTVPLIASGGSGCYDDMVNLFRETTADACAIGKMLFLRDYDIVRIKSYLHGAKVPVRDA
jgi:cyclase